MTSQWYCTDCETQIDASEVEGHEADGHHVKGLIRPDRLIGNDPWNMRIEAEGDVDSPAGVERGGDESPSGADPDEGGER
jgi:hypothetical protein